jgi:type I restriction enzyme R subunit
MTYNEADTRANLIDPQLNIAGWTRSQVTRERYYRPDFDGVTTAFVRFLK